MISAIVIVHEKNCCDAIIQQAGSFIGDAVILTLGENGYTIWDHATGRIYSTSATLKSYGELVNECLNYVSEEYAVLLKEGECISLEKKPLELDEHCLSASADILEDMYEGTVKHKEARIFRKGIILKGNYQLDELPQICSCGLTIQGFSAGYKRFLKEWIDREYEESLKPYIWEDERMLAECCYAIGQYDDACRHFKRIYSSQQFQPSYELYRDMCWAFIAGDCLTDGKDAVEEALAAFPGCREIYYIAAVIYKELDDYGRCISCMEKIEKCACQMVGKELMGYSGIRSNRLLAEAFYSIEDYRKAGEYYRLCALEGPVERSYTISLCASLNLSGLCQRDIEEYLKERLSLDPTDVAEIIAEFYKKYRLWGRLSEYAGGLQGVQAAEAAAESMYHMKFYRKCLYQVVSSGLISQEGYLIMGLCCLLLDTSIPRETSRDFIVKLKNTGSMELLHMYEYFMGDRKLPCSEGLLERFTEILLETGDSRCIKYIRQAMDENACMDYMKLINTAFANGLYYFCEEIINIYYPEGRYEYEVLRILAYVYYFTGNLSECERYISYAIIMRKSTELIKLGCACKLKECRELIKGYENSMDVKSIQRLLNTISEYENIIVLH